MLPRWVTVVLLQDPPSARREARSRKTRARRRFPRRASNGRYGRGQSPDVPASRATNGWECAEKCGKQRRAECPRGEGPRRIHFGGEGRREPPYETRLERRSVKLIGVLERRTPRNVANHAETAPNKVPALGAFGCRPSSA